MEYYKNLLNNNKEWVKNKLATDKTFFEKQSMGQEPKVFWIGCSDSRVPANLVTGTEPGDIFVHRNIANLVVHTDMSILATLDYAVNVLEVQHIIICGHYGCGGINAALSHKQHGIIDNWLMHIKDVYRTHQEELNMITSPEKKARRLTELNVIEQVGDLVSTSIVQKAWNKKRELSVHGWVYDICSGLITDLDVTHNMVVNEGSIFTFIQKDRSKI